jgi:urease accessory protein
MLMIRRHLTAGVKPHVDDVTLELVFDTRKRSRHRLTLPDGKELAWALLPGTMLHPGDRLDAADGDAFACTFVVAAAAEPVLRVTANTPLALTRAAYHLGNRHISVEVGDGYLAITPDPVLQDMLAQLDVRVDAVNVPFQPETGAYGGGHKHGHDATFAEDYALAQAVFRRHETDRSPLLNPHDQ